MAKKTPKKTNLYEGDNEPNTEFDLRKLHRGMVCYNEREESGIVLALEPIDVKDARYSNYKAFLKEGNTFYHATGLYLDGKFDCEYRRTSLEQVKTRKGWAGVSLRVIGFIGGSDLERVIALADTGKTYSYHDRPANL